MSSYTGPHCQPKSVNEARQLWYMRAAELTSCTERVNINGLLPSQRDLTVLGASIPCCREQACCAVR